VRFAEDAEKLKAEGDEVEDKPGYLRELYKKSYQAYTTAQRLISGARKATRQC